MISRRHIRLVIALLLPLMVLRAMLPAGYMPVAENGQLRMVMCSEGLYPAASGLADTQADTGEHKLPPSGDCPFASSALTVPPVQFLASFVVSVPEFRFHSMAVDALPPSTGPPRRTAARAPPALS